MPETKQLLREAGDRIAAPPDVLGGLARRRRHKENVKRGAAAAVAIVVALVGIGGWFVLERDTAPRPADRSLGLGIFAPVAGRIVYANEGFDGGYGPGVWAADPYGPGDTKEGARVAHDVVSTLVRLDIEDGEPLGWSGDGTELLLMRTDGDSPFPQQYLYILHADGSETQLNRDPMYFGGATISPDGTRVVFAAWGDDLGLWVVDAEGGSPVRLPMPGVGGIVAAPTFSPDGTQIAYLDTGNHENHVWVANADGTDAHEILADEATVLAGGSGLQWSPAGDLLAIELDFGDGSGRPGIYTFASDGSDLRQVVDGGIAPFWSPDGSQIAFTIPCDEHPDRWCEEGSALRTSWNPQPGDPRAGLAIADEDTSGIQVFGFAASGPWHPGHGWVGDGALDPTSDGEVLDRISKGEVVNGWPDTNRNHGGLYSWDGYTCGSEPQSYCTLSGAGGFMHNGYGSGDVDIVLEVRSGGTVPGDGAVVAVAGHVGVYRRIDAQRERWIVDIAGTTMSISLTAKPGASRSDLADAHAIIGSMRTEPQDSYLGFRMVFILTNNDWDSG